MRRTLGLVPFVLLACGPAPQPVPPPKPAPIDAGLASHEPKCPSPLDMTDLLARHAKAFGTREAAIASLPTTSRGTMERAGLAGTFEIARDKKRRRISGFLKGLYRASGYDDQGAWEMGTHGVVQRLRPGETRQHGTWIEQRGYLSDFDPARDKAKCEVVDGRVLARLQYDLPAEGNPVIIVDADSAELVASVFGDIDGSQILWRYDRWSEPDDHGVRWPLEQQEHTEAGPGAHLSITETKKGLVCASLGTGAPVAADCMSAPASPLVIAWPANGPKRARVPMKDGLDIVILRPKVGGKEVVALLDPTEGLVGVVDDAGPQRTAFTSASHIVLGALTFDIGTISASLGGLEIRGAPALLRELGAQDQLGSARPAIVAGAPFALPFAVRVDHKKQEIVFAPAGEPLAAKNATQIPLRVLGDKLIVEASIGGKKAPMSLQFQRSVGVQLYDGWSKRNDALTGRPTLTLGKDSALARLPQVELGPAKWNDQLAEVGTHETPHDLAGVLSVSVLLRCDAFTIDVQQRSIWLEGACDRTPLEDYSGWMLVRDVKSPAAPPIDRPWTVGAMLKDGSADHAGIKEGDRVLEIGGKPATVDRELFFPLLAQKPGTKVPVVIMRGTEKKTVTMELIKPLQ
jgi:hypothetical protein